MKNLKIVELPEAESGMVVARGWGEKGMGSCCSMYKVSVLQDE